MNVNVTTETIRPVMARSARLDSGASVDIGVSAGLISLKKRDCPIGWARTWPAGRFFRTRRIAKGLVGEGFAGFCGAGEEFASGPQAVVDRETLTGFLRLRTARSTPGRHRPSAPATRPGR